MAKCPDILPILNFAEDLEDTELTPEALQRESNSCRWMTEINTRRLSEVVWGFLNTCLTDKARTCFEGADILNGFDAWRRVIQHVHQGANVRLGTLRKAVKNPPKIGSLQDIDSGITRFESIMRDYRMAGGSPPEGIELKNDFLETLPSEIREGLMWRATEVNETFAQFTAHVRSTANAILFHRGKTTSSMNNIDELPIDGDGDGYDEEILAVQRRWGRVGGGWRPTRQGGSAGPGRQAAPERRDSRAAGGDHP